MRQQSILFEEVTFYIFLALGLWMFGRVFRDPSQFLTFPVVTGAIWLAYIAPQAFGILYNPIHLPPLVFEGGYSRTMIMCCLCMMMGLLGWSARFKRPVTVRAGPGRPLDLDPNRLMVSGTILTILGYAAFIIITRQTDGIVGYYSVGGSYSLDWLGEEVIAVFFQNVFMNTGLVVLMFSLHMRPRLITGIVALAALAPSIADIVILNRRSDVIYVAIGIFGSASFVRKWAPRRQMVTIGIVLGMFVVFVFPVIRGSFLIGAEQRGVDLIQAFQQAVFEDVLGGDASKEFNNSIGIVASAAELDEFGCGALTWNSWIETTIPRQLVGEEIKTSLQVKTSNYADIGQRAYNWMPTWFQSRSAAALMFVEFWYLGSLVFFLIGYGFAQIYSRASVGNTGMQMIYVSFLMFLPHFIAEGFYKAPRNLIATLTLLAAVFSYAKIRRRHRSLSQTRHESVATADRSQS